MIITWNTIITAGAVLAAVSAYVEAYWDKLVKAGPQ